MPLARGDEFQFGVGDCECVAVAESVALNGRTEKPSSVKPASGEQGLSYTVAQDALASQARE